MLKKSIPEFVTIMLLVFAALFVLASCSGKQNSDSFPQVASPPPFDFPNGENLRSGMHQLAFALLDLDRELSSETEVADIEQREVTETLMRIKEIAEGLQEGDIRLSHPYLADDMFRFLNDIDQALWQASRRSPRYYMAGRVSGACVSCHSANN